MITAKPHCCEEAAMGMGDAYIPCNKPATKIVRPKSDTEPDLRMCDGCADHSVRNRGMTLVNDYFPTQRTQAEKVAYWTNLYNYWRAKIGLRYPQEFGDPQAFEDTPCAGFYRRGVYEKQEGKRSKRVGWLPAAVFKNGSEIIAVIGGRALDVAQTVEAWTHISGNPISEEWYRAVAERGEPWPDSHEADKAKSKPDPEADAAIERAYIAEDDRRNAAEDALPQNKIAAELAECRKLLPKYKTLDSDEASSKARSLQNRFLDLRGQAGKAYEAANRPLLDQQKALREIWFPLRDDADGAVGELRRAMEGWEDTKRQAARRAAEAAEKAAREHAEAARKAAEANQLAPPPPPEPEKPNTPPPAAQIRGGAGRAASVRVEVVVTAIDVMKVAEQFKDSPQLREFLMGMAQKAIRAGIPVPGATTEEKSVVR